MYQSINIALLLMFFICFYMYSSIFSNPDPSVAPTTQAALCDTAAASDNAESSNSALRGRHHSTPHSTNCNHPACPASSTSAVPCPAQSACYLPTSHRLPFHVCSRPKRTVPRSEPKKGNSSTAYLS